jgi:murein DD-endopeptidase MepM/ murein hydrolase activator NlpD
MFKSKLKSLFNLEAKWVKLGLIGLGIIILLAILALLGSMRLQDGGLKFNQPKTAAPVSEELPLTPGAEPQFEAPKSLTDPEQVALAEQVRAAAAAREDVMAFIIYDVAVDNVEYSKDGKLALVWISLVDKETGLVQPGEPGLVIAQEKKNPTKPWKLTFQADAGFAAALQAVPNKLLSAEVKAFYMPALQQEQKSGMVYSGYRLPWKPGQTVRLTGSIGHVYTYKSCPSSCLYAFDFANGTMFDVVAARAGTVKYVVWKYENGDPKNANYIVLEDTSTSPTTYQVYLHLAHESIPAELRKVGAKVVQGQFLGKADDTGYSTGHHLHFHVHTNPESYWGKSVDIVFDDVTVNGGRPRLCSEAKAYPQFGSECVPQDKYVSNNGDSELPTGGISSPEAGTKIKAPTVNITGWMKDDMGVASGQLYIKLGSQKWKPIGNTYKKTEFSRSLDLCAAGIPDGEFSLAIEVTDKAGNVSALMGETKLVKDYDCPAQPPVCVPANDEVALYSDPDFQGSCQLLKVGEYPNLADLPQVGADKAQSIQVGANVTALLFPEINFAGVEEVFQDGDNNLGNNPIGSANAASAKVIARQLLPAPVEITLPDAISTDTVLTIAWTTEAGAETRAVLSGPGDYTNGLDWQAGGSWQVGKLDRGNYTLTIEVRNTVGIATTTQEFTVSRVNTAPETHMQYLPQGSKSTSIKLTWVVDSGAATIDHFDLQWREGKGEWTDWTEPLGRTAREAIFWAVPDKLYEFRIRAVDKNGAEESFTSKPETSTYVLPDCADDAFEGEGSGDDERASAPVAQYGAVQTHNWCQLGDVDWVVFQAAEGDALTLRVDPSGAASGAIIKLFDAGSDEPLAKATPQNADSATVLNWTAPAPGTYAVKLSPADTRIAGEDAQYTFSLQKRSLVRTSWFLVLVGLISALLGGGFFTHRRIQAKKMQKGVGW